MENTPEASEFGAALLGAPSEGEVTSHSLSATRFVLCEASLVESGKLVARGKA